MWSRANRMKVFLDAFLNELKNKSYINAFLCSNKVSCHRTFTNKTNCFFFAKKKYYWRNRAIIFKYNQTCFLYVQFENERNFEIKKIHRTEVYIKGTQIRSLFKQFCLFIKKKKERNFVISHCHLQIITIANAILLFD